MATQQMDRGFEVVGSTTCGDIFPFTPDRWNVDPLAADAADDEVVITTCRRLLRLSIAATEVGARFARERTDHDPAAWMLAPRAVFDDRSPIDACQELDGFSRNVLLHGLGLGLDADPSYIDDLLSDDDRVDIEDREDVPNDVVVQFPAHPQPRLLTCWVDADQGDGRLFAFCALVTDQPADLVHRVVGRFGAAAATAASYHVGFDQTTALATAMISPAMTDMLLLVAEDPSSSLAAGLDVVVEQRFHA